MSFPFDAVGIASALATSLFLIALRSQRHVPLAAATGVLTLVVAALYTADLLNLPQALAAFMIGAASGSILGRDVSARWFPTMMAVGAGATALCAAAVAGALWIDPSAFVLIGAIANPLSASDQSLLCFSLGAGLLALLAGLAALVRRARAAGSFWAISGAGWAVSGGAFLLDNWGMAAAGGMAASATLVVAVRRVVERKGLADPIRHP